MSVPGAAVDPPVPERWTVLSLLQWAAAYLTAREFDEARLHVELLLGRVLGLERIALYLQFDRPLTPAELAAFKALFRRRLDHEPLQYILGETAFMGLTLTVEPAVLIPRPETELLVEAAVTGLRASAHAAPAVLDIGTGSGCIALGIAHLVPSADVLGIDRSREALAVARKNHERYPALRVRFEEQDAASASWPPSAFDLIVSNPPYIALEEYRALAPEVRDHEPRMALTDEGDGLSFYDVLFDAARRALRPGGLLLCEIGHGQEEAITVRASGHGCRVVRVTRDYAGIPRVLEAVVDTPAQEG